MRGARPATGRNRTQVDRALNLEPKILRIAASVTLVALMVLCLAWELWLAPLRPGGSYLALKAPPLAIPLLGILLGKRYTYQWSSMFVLAYFTEGVVRAWSERGMSQILAGAEIALSVVFFAAVVAYSRATRPT